MASGWKTFTSRRHGEAKASVASLLERLAQIALDEGCGRLEWDVLTWNVPAIAVYERLGARTLTEWRIMRVSGAALQNLARGDRS